MCHAEKVDAHDLYEAALEGYLNGLHDAGWQGNPDHVRYGCAGVAAMSLLRGWCGLMDSIFQDESKRAWIEQFLGLPFKEILDLTARLTSLSLGLMDKTQELENTLF